MQPIKFYAEKRNLIIGAVFSIVQAFITFEFSKFVQNPVTSAILVIVSLFWVTRLFPIARIRLNDDPVFTADAEGFQVLRHKKLPWSAIKKVSTAQPSLYWLIPIGARYVSIKLQRGRTLTIPHTFLPGSATETAGAILQLKEQAELAQMGPTATSEIPAVAPEPRARRASHAPRDDGPIQSPRGLFSRKVL